jgi:hypothetical protein
LHARGSNLNAAAATSEAQTGLVQPGLLPDGLKGSVVKQQRRGLHGLGEQWLLQTMLLDASIGLTLPWHPRRQ